MKNTDIFLPVTSYLDTYLLLHFRTLNLALC